jgi:hypothetical protein
MTSQSEQVISSPSWGAALARREERRRAVRAQTEVHFPPGASGLEGALAVLLLAAPFALWAAFLAATW